MAKGMVHVLSELGFAVVAYHSALGSWVFFLWEKTVSQHFLYTSLFKKAPIGFFSFMHLICQGLEPGLLDAEGHLFWGGGYITTLCQEVWCSGLNKAANYLAMFLNKWQGNGGEKAKSDTSHLTFFLFFPFSLQKQSKDRFGLEGDEESTMLEESVSPKKWVYTTGENALYLRVTFSSCGSFFQIK